MNMWIVFWTEISWILVSSKKRTMGPLHRGEASVPLLHINVVGKKSGLSQPLPPSLLQPRGNHYLDHVQLYYEEDQESEMVFFYVLIFSEYV